MTAAFEWRARSLDEGLEGWPDLIGRAWSAYEAWWLQDEGRGRPPLDLCRAALDRHMHALMPLWERLCHGRSEDQKRFLSFWSPPAYIKACSQAAVARPEPLLVRNYDYGAEAFDCLVLRTDWLGRRVIGVSDGLWGLLDGMNDLGLCVSLAFGGRWQVGPGFGIPLILRYVLQVAGTTAEAVAILKRVPSHMSYNVTVLDAAGAVATVRVAPDRAPRAGAEGIATNHQRPEPDWPEHARLTRTQDRLSCLENLMESDAPGRGLVERFLSPPLHVAGFRRGFGTLYTAAYRPAERSLSLNWPGLSRRMGLDRALHWDLTVHLAADAHAPARRA